MTNKKNEKKEINKNVSKKEETNKKVTSNKKKDEELNKNSFLYKYKNDKKYNSAVKLTGYVIFVLTVVLMINLSSLNNSYSNGNFTKPIPNNEEVVENTKLIETIKNNYRYDITIDITKNTDEVIKYHYYGKSYEDTTEMYKDLNESTFIFYKVGESYYTPTNDGYQKIETKQVYDNNNPKYVELTGLLNYLKEASLDHFTNYSSGKKEYIYHLYLKDIILSNKTNDYITIKAIEENEVLSINVDYTNLIVNQDNSIKNYTINYVFNDINKVEEFSIYETREN